MTATLAPVRPARSSWPRWRRRRSIGLVVDTSALLADLVANTGGRWGEVSWSRFGNVSSTRRGRLLVEVHHGDGSSFSPPWRLLVRSETGSVLAEVDPSSRGVWGSGIPAQMTALLGRLPA